jgi:hypothetical protein
MFDPDPLILHGWLVCGVAAITTIITIQYQNQWL